MLIIGCDYHPGFQPIALVDTDTGELGEQRLVHREEAEGFYGKLKEQSMKMRVGMESSGHSRWFERLLHELGFELWIENPAEIRTKRVRKQKTDRQDAQLLLRLMLENRFPEGRDAISRLGDHWTTRQKRDLGSGTPVERQACGLRHGRETRCSIGIQRQSFPCWRSSPVRNGMR